MFMTQVVNAKGFTLSVVFYQNSYFNDETFAPYHSL